MASENLGQETGRDLVLRDVATTLPAILDAEIDAARSYAEASRSPATRRAYASDWKLFAAWCAVRQFGSLPAVPAVVALFVAAEAQRGIAASTI